MSASVESLKAKLHLIRDGQPEALRLRIHRALGRLTRAEREQDDLDDLLGVPRPWCVRTRCGRTSV
jgi:hypothetical protein